MKAKVYLISSDYIKQFTVVSNTLNDQIVNVAIERAQLQFILPALGLPLYNRIVDTIFQNGSYASLPTRYIELIEDFVQPTLQEYALWILIPQMHYNFSQKGIGLRQDQYQVPAEVKDLTYLRSDILNSAKFYMERLQKFLCEYKNELIEYTEPSYDLEANKKAGKMNAVYFPTRRKRGTIVPLYKDEPNNETTNYI